MIIIIIQCALQLDEKHMTTTYGQNKTPDFGLAFFVCVN